LKIVNLLSVYARRNAVGPVEKLIDLDCFDCIIKGLDATLASLDGSKRSDDEFDAVAALASASGYSEETIKACRKGQAVPRVVADAVCLAARTLQSSHSTNLEVVRVARLEQKHAPADSGARSGIVLSFINMSSKAA
jgi:hypothetical protein